MFCRMKKWLLCCSIAFLSACGGDRDPNAPNFGPHPL